MPVTKKCPNQITLDSKAEESKAQFFLEYCALDEVRKHLNTLLWKNSRILCFGILEYSALECLNTLLWNARILCPGMLEYSALECLKLCFGVLKCLSWNHSWKMCIPPRNIEFDVVAQPTFWLWAHQGPNYIWHFINRCNCRQACFAYICHLINRYNYSNTWFVPQRLLKHTMIFHKSLLQQPMQHKKMQTTSHNFWETCTKLPHFHQNKFHCMSCITTRRPALSNKHSEAQYSRNVNMLTTNVTQKETQNCSSMKMSSCLLQLSSECVPGEMTSHLNNSNSKAEYSRDSMQRIKKTLNMASKTSSYHTSGIICLQKAWPHLHRIHPDTGSDQISRSLSTNQWSS